MDAGRNVGGNVRGRMHARGRGASRDEKVGGLTFTPEGDRVVSCSDDGSVRIWRLPQADAPAED